MGLVGRSGLPDASVGPREVMIKSPVPSLISVSRARSDFSVIGGKRQLTIGKGRKAVREF